jgi:hypothetical protein
MVPRTSSSTSRGILLIAGYLRVYEVYEYEYEYEYKVSLTLFLFCLSTLSYSYIVHIVGV